MYFNKYYSYKTKEYIHKVILSERELFLFKKVIRGYMPEVDYNKILVKRLNLNEEYRYIDSPNSIGVNTLEEIEKSGLKYYVVELTQDEKDELYEQLFNAVILMEDYRNATDNLVENMYALNLEARDKIQEELQKQMKEMGIKPTYN